MRNRPTFSMGSREVPSDQHSTQPAAGRSWRNLLLLAAVIVALLAGCSCSKKEPKKHPEPPPGSAQQTDITVPISESELEDIGYGEEEEAPTASLEPNVKNDQTLKLPSEVWWDDIAKSTSNKELDAAIIRLRESDGSEVAPGDQKLAAAVASSFVVADATGVGRDKFPEQFEGSFGNGQPAYSKAHVLGVGVDGAIVHDDRVAATTVVAWAGEDSVLHLSWVFLDSSLKPIPEFEVGGWSGAPTMPTEIVVEEVDASTFKD